MASVYDLIANIPHETTSASTNAGGSGASSKKNERDEGDTVWKVHVRAGAGGGDAEKWFALQDLDVTEVRKEMVFLGETVVQVSRIRLLWCLLIPNTLLIPTRRSGNGETSKSRYSRGSTLQAV
jgi:hypothetical protein